MSSLRNSLHRRNHKERSQLSHRARLGILEKHKDYVKRAQDYHSKQRRVKQLKEKAAARNKDEFYFGMVNSKTEGGVHAKDRGNVALPVDMVKVLKSQDENYVRAVRQAERKRIDKLKTQLTALTDLVNADAADSGENALDEDELQTLRDAGIIPAPSSKGEKPGRKDWQKEGKHIVFVSNPDEARNYQPPSIQVEYIASQKPNTSDSETMHLGWDWEDEKKPFQKDTAQAEKDDPVLDMEAVTPDTSGYRKRLLKELAARLKRDTNLRYTARELEMQRLMMGKGAARKIRGVERVEPEGDEDDEDALDARRGKKRQKVDIGMEETTYRPRVYKWRAERKK